MAESNVIKGATKHGTRYGSRNRNKVAAIENQYQAAQKCPHCAKVGVKREAAGIFECRKCGVKFTARAYTTEKTSVADIE